MYKKKLSFFLFFAVFIFLFVSGCASDSKEVFEDNLPDEVEEPSENNFPVYLTNYIEQPTVSFDVYDTYEPIKGIYVSAFRAGAFKSDGTSFMDDILQFVADTEINAIVLDVKDDDGLITFKNKMPKMDEMGLSANYIPRIDELMQRLLDEGVYPIARIVTFKDNGIALLEPERMVKSGDDGEVYRDNAGNAWLNPYYRDNWDYVLESAKAAVQLGFKEIQFDYVRFVADARLNESNLGDMGGLSKEEIITAFLAYAVEVLHPLGVKVSADVYGTAIANPVDQAIVGQNYVELAKILDVICPMVYPSHYGQGSFGVQYPDLEPGKIIYESMKLSAAKLAEIPDTEHKAIVRPWLQDFTATYLRTNYQVYGGQQRREQIEAVYEAGKTEWLLWDPAVSYSAEGLQ